MVFDLNPTHFAQPHVETRVRIDRAWLYLALGQYSTKLSSSVLISERPRLVTIYSNKIQTYQTHLVAKVNLLYRPKRELADEVLAPSVLLLRSQHTPTHYQARCHPVARRLILLLGQGACDLRFRFFYSPRRLIPLQEAKKPIEISINYRTIIARMILAPFQVPIMRSIIFRKKWIILSLCQKPMKRITLIRWRILE